MTPLILAAEIGGTKLQLFLGTPQGEIVWRERAAILPEKGHEGILQSIAGLLPAAQAAAKAMGGRVAKAAAGFGGTVHSEKGVTLASDQVAGWDNFPLADWLSQRIGTPAFVFNDSDAAAFGEYKKGTGDGCRNFLYMNIGSGIGGGIVIDGRLFTGQGYGAAEVGLMLVPNPWGENPAAAVPVEDVCSGWAIEERLRRAEIPASSLLWKQAQSDRTALTCAALGKAAAAGDAFAVSFLEESAQVFCMALAGAINLLSPEIVAIGGGVSLIGEPLFSAIRRFVKPYLPQNSPGRLEVVKAQLEEDVVPVGTVLLAAEK